MATRFSTVRFGWRQACGVLLSAGLGCYAGYSLGAAAPAGAPAQCSRQEPGEASRKLGAVDARLRRIEAVQQATLRACSSRPTESCSAPADEQATETQPPPANAELEDQTTPEQDEALLASQRILESALQAGHWTDADKQEFRSTTSLLNSERHSELLRQLARSINEGELEVATHGPPY